MDNQILQIQQACMHAFHMVFKHREHGECAVQTRKTRKNDLKTGWGWRIILERFEHCGHFSMATGMGPAASKKDHYKRTKVTIVILEATCSLPKHQVFSASISGFL